MDDQSLNREIESALHVDPSPEFLAKVRTRIAAEPEPSRWRLAWVMVPASAVFVIGVAMLWPRVESPAGIAETRVEPVATQAPPVVPAPDRAPVPTVSASLRQRVVRSSAPLAVVVNAAERDAFERLVTRIAMGDMPSGDTMIAPPDMPREIEFDLVTIAPIAFVPDVEEGERQ